MAIGVDVGGSSIKCALVDLNTGEFASQRFSTPTPAQDSPEALLAALANVVSNLPADHPVGLAFPSVIQNGNFRALRGTEGEPGSFLLTGKIADDGSAKLSGDGFINSRKYARGVFAHKGEEYTWDVKAQFKDTEGSGARNEGLGIVGRPCTFEFTRQQPGAAAPAAPAPPGL